MPNQKYSGLACLKCGEMGHSQRLCPQKEPVPLKGMELTYTLLQPQKNLLLAGMLDHFDELPESLQKMIDGLAGEHVRGGVAAQKRGWKRKLGQLSDEQRDNQPRQASGSGGGMGGIVRPTAPPRIIKSLPMRAKKPRTG
ncbi:hypothetical protein B0H63DRAFT_507379 [Podospora didyma]|uniref:CCHC-type domain-containing protein n=1 Tax=Podospora didyma TaxID=330526 RepID=A0AAE0U3V8_9PEZI|nr:hypothetical protein B0H63DRAFT_507379 [Podospora didyma]